MTEPVAITNAEADRFPSLAAMSNTHRDLLKRHREAGDTAEITSEIEQFILRGRSTGALLDDEDDRWVAQGLLDYWTTKVYRTGYEPPDGTLAEFDPNLAPELPDDLCPYLGLETFREGDREVFFGRQAVIEAALKILQDKRLLAVVGSSGCGKSSLVLAGLLPKLKSGALPGSDKWRYLPPIVPGQEPLRSLAALIQPEQADESWIEKQVQAFSASTSHLTLLIEQANAAPAVVVVDQLEEIFTLSRDDAVRMAFVDNLLGLVQSPNARHIVILTLRVDFQSQVTRIPRLQALFNEGGLGVPALNAGELRDTIEKPAELIGLKFEEGLVDQLVRDVLGEPAALPLLQFTLLKLWENRERNRMTWAAYQKMGGGRNALSYSADELYNSLIPEDQVTCKRILLRIVRPGEGLEVTSNRVPRSSLYRAGEAHDRVDRVLDRLLKSRLLKQTEGETPGDAHIEVAHEALVRNWPTLVEWLDEERANLRNRLRLTAAAKQWKQLGKEKGALLRGVMLHNAESYDDLNELEQEYVRASRDAVDAARREKEAARQRELEHAQKLAESERQQAQIQARAAQQLRRRAVLLTIALIFAGIFAVTAVGSARLAIQNAEQADRNRQVAVEQAATANAASTQAVANAQAANEASILALNQQRTAQAASTQAVAQQATAIAERNVASTAQSEALLQARIALSRQLAAQALNYLDLKLDLAMLLSVEAHQTFDTLEAKNAMLLGLQRGLGQLTVQIGDPLPSPDGYVNSVAFSRDGKVLAVGTEDGSIVLWDVVTRTQLGTLRGHTSQVFGLAFSPDGKTLASGSADGTVILWDYGSGLQAYQTPQTPFGVLSVAFSPDGATLAAGRNDSRIVLLDVATRQELRLLEGHRDKVWSVAWSPDGRSLASASGDSTARVWEASTGRLLLNLRGGHTRAVRSVAWTKDGIQLVTASQDGTIVVWDASTGKPVGDPLTGHTDQVLSLAFSRDGNTLASGSADRAVILWDFANRRPIDVLHDHDHWVITVAFSPDGKTLASGSIDKTVVLREVVVQQGLGQPLTGSKGPLQSAALADDGSILAAVRPSGGATSLWNLTTGVRMAQLSSYQAVAFSRDGRLAALGSADKVEFYSLVEGRLLPTSIKVLVLSLALNGNGMLLATASCGLTDVQGFCVDNILQIWNAATGELVKGLEASHTDSILSIAFSADDSLVATGSQDNTIILWDTGTWTPVGLPLSGHTDRVTSLTFSPDGRILASGSADSNLILWEVSTRQPIGQPFSAHARTITALAFDGTGATLLSGGDDGAMFLWTTSPQAWESRACEIAKRNLTQGEWDQFLAGRLGSYHKTCEQWPAGQ